MKKYFKRIIFILIGGSFPFLFTLHWWWGYEKDNSSNTILPSNFFHVLQNITGTLLIWPTPELYTRYQEFLNTTKNTLKIQTYEFSNTFIKEFIKSRLNSWVDVQIIIEDQKYQQYTNPLKQLQSDFSGYQNISIKSDQQMWTTYTHSKITLSESAFRIQSANLTASSFEKNREHFFYSNNGEVLSSLHLLFDNDWKWEVLKSEDFHPNLVVCPINCRIVIEELLSQAEESIVIQTQYIMDPVILDILREKSEQLSLHIIVADTIENANVTSYFGPGIARILKSNYNHTKIILVDNKYLLLGSMNLSDNSLDNNREIWIILLDTELIQIFLSGFWSDWKYWH